MTLFGKLRHTVKTKPARLYATQVYGNRDVFTGLFFTDCQEIQAGEYLSLSSLSGEQGRENLRFHCRLEV